jgi:DNA-binding MarR family transcriptional regulator
MEHTQRDRGSVLIDLLLKSHRVAKTLALSTQLPLDELYCLALIHSEAPSCVKVLSRLLGVRGPRTSKLLGSLERKGYLKRTMNAVDHRMEEVGLTEEGLQAVYALIRHSTELLDHLLDQGEIEQLQRMVGLLEHVRTRADRHRSQQELAADRRSGWFLIPDEE